MQPHRTFLPTGLALALLLITACSNDEPAKKPGQVVAKVNNEEISIHQLNFVLSRAGGVNADNLEAAKQKIVNSLIDQSLMYQKALAEKLDRDPAIMMAVEQAKRQVLAQAWLERATQNIDTPTAKDIEDYYRAHPELFAQHKTFKLKEVLIEQTEAHQAKLAQHLSDSKTIDELIGKLDADQIVYQVTQATQVSENIPLEQLPALHALKAGEFITIDRDQHKLVTAVLDAKEQRIDPKKAAPIIETYLINQQRKKLAEATLKTLKDQATIEHIGEIAANATVPKTPDTLVETNAPDEQTQAIGKGVKGLVK